MRPRKTNGNSEAGFTIVEMMVVLGLIGALAAATTTAFSRDRGEQDFSQAGRQIVQELTAGRFVAASQRDDFVLFFGAADVYSMYRRAPDTRAISDVVHVCLPERVKIRGVLARAALPGTVYALPDSQSFPATLVISSRGSVTAAVAGGSEAASSVTIFLEGDEGLRKSRVVIFGATALVRSYPGW